MKEEDERRNLTEEGEVVRERREEKRIEIERRLEYRK